MYKGQAQKEKHMKNLQQSSQSDTVELIESLSMIDHSMEDIRKGRVQSAKPALKRIADELGLKLDRQPGSENRLE